MHVNIRQFRLRDLAEEAVKEIRIKTVVIVVEVIVTLATYAIFVRVGPFCDGNSLLVGVMDLLGKTF